MNLTRKQVAKIRQLAEQANIDRMRVIAQLRISETQIRFLSKLKSELLALQNANYLAEQELKVAEAQIGRGIDPVPYRDKHATALAELRLHEQKIVEAKAELNVLQDLISHLNHISAPQRSLVENILGYAKVSRVDLGIEWIDSIDGNMVDGLVAGQIAEALAGPAPAPKGGAA